MEQPLFISYSRADMAETDWLARLKMYLAPLERAGTVNVWHDGRIETGADWRAEIENALQRARAAVLLVGPGFLASRFIMESELPGVLEAASRRGTKVLPLIVGYCGYRASKLERYQAVNDPDKPLESLSRADQNKILNELAISIDRAFRTAPASATAVDASSQAYRDSVREIATQLGDTRTAFVAQCRRRDDLVEMLERRLGMRNDLEYEKFFFKYYPELNEAERFEFDQIRAMTEGPLYNGNRRILELLENVQGLTDEILELTDLRQHLVFWLNKFDRVFRNNKAMCLLYTGVEDGVPFPAHLDDAIAECLGRS